jgi:hypothetical protein
MPRFVYSKAFDLGKPGVVPRMNYSGTFSLRTRAENFKARQVASFIYKGRRE